MAKTFQLTANLNLKGPYGLASVTSQLRKQLGNVPINLQVNLSTQAINQVRATNSYLGQLNKTLKDLNVNSRLVTNAMNALAKSIGNVGQASQALNGLASKVTAVTKATSKGAASLEQFGSASALAVKRFAAYTVAAGSIYAVTRAFTSGIKEAFEFQREMVRVSQVTGKTLASLGGLSKEITRLSTTFGVSSKELSQVTTTLAQAGLSFNDVKTSLEALAKSSLSPTFGKIADTTEVAIAAMAQFKIEAKDLEKTLGSINSVAAAFAVESDDLGVVIRRSGGAFKAAGGELNELLALFTSVRATTRESAESIATGFRTIFTRLQRKDTVDLLKDFGIELRDLKGQFVGPLDAIQKLSTALNSIQSTDPRFSQIVEELGGFRQVSKVIPLIQQFALTQKALGVAEEGAGSLARDATTAQQALLVQVTKVKEEFADLFRTIANDAAVQGLVKAFLSLSSSLAGVSKTLVPLLPLFVGLGIAKGSAGAIKFGGGFRKGFLGFASGGVVPGHGNGDTVPANLTPGEFVINKKSAQAIGYDKLKGINKLGQGSKDFVKKPKGGEGATGVIEISGDYGGLFLQPDGLPDSNPLGAVPLKELSKKTKEQVLRAAGAFESQIGYVQGNPKAFYIGQDGRQKFHDVARKDIYDLTERLAKQLGGGLPSNLTSHLNGQEAKDKFFKQIGGNTTLGNLFEGALSLLSLNFNSTNAAGFDLKEKGNDAFLLKMFSASKLPTLLDAKLTATTGQKGSISDLVKKAANEIPSPYVKATRLLASGGGINGTDTVPALLTPGEFVINKDAARKLGASTLNKMNKFALGGPVKLAFGGFGRKKPVNPGFPNLGDLMNPPNNVPITPSTAFPSLTDLYTQGASSAPTPRKFGGKFGAAATIGLTLGGGQVINSAFGTVSHDNTSSRAVTGSGLQGGLAGAAAGASIGSLFGPIGTVAGGAVGGLLGFTSALKQAEKEVKEIKLGKELDVLSETLAQINSQGFIGPTDISRGNASIGGLLSQRSNITNLQDLNQLDEGLRSSKQSILDFGANLAKDVTTIEGFNEVGSEVIQALSAIDKVPVDEVRERFAKLIDAQNKNIEIQNKLNQVENVRLSIQQKAINIGNTLADVNNSGRNLGNITDVAGGGKFSITGSGDILSRAGNTFQKDLFKKAATSTGNLFGGDNSKLVENAVAFQNAASELPSIIARVASQPQLEGENVIQKLRDELKAANITGELQSIIADGANAFGAGLDDFLDEALAAPEKTAKKLLEGLDGIANTLASADQAYNGTVNRFLSNVEASVQKQAALQANIVKIDELKLGKLRTERGFNPDASINVGAATAIFDNRQSALTGGRGFGLNPAGIGAALSSVQEEIRKTEESIRANSTDKTFTTQAGDKLGKLQIEANNLTSALERLTDVSNRTADASERLGQIEKSRSELRSIGEKLAFGSAKDLRQLQKDLTLTQIAGKQGLGAIPQNLRAGVGGLLGSLGSTNLKGLGGGTGNQIIDKLIQGLIGGELGGLLGNKPQGEELQLRKDILDAFDTAQKAQAELNASESKKRDAFIDAMHKEFDAFINGLKTQSLDALINQNKTELGVASAQAQGLRGKQRSLSTLTSLVGEERPEAAVARANAAKVLIERKRKNDADQENLSKSSGKFLSTNFLKQSIPEISNQLVEMGLPKDIRDKVLGEAQKARSSVYNPSIPFYGKVLGKGSEQSQYEGTIPTIQRKIQEQLALGDSSIDIERSAINRKIKESFPDFQNLSNNFDTLSSSLQDLNGVDLNKLNTDLDTFKTRISELQKTLFYQSIDRSKLNTPLVTRAGGGNIFQPRGSDTVPAMLTPGEYVINARQAQANAGLLEEINNSNGPVYAAAGGRPIRSRKGNFGGQYGPIMDRQARAIAKAAARKRRLGLDVGYGGVYGGSGDSINDIRRARREQQISDRAERRLKRRFQDENFMEAAKAYGLAPSEKSSPEFGTPEFEQSLQEKYGAYTEKRNRALRLNRIRANGRTREAPQIAAVPIAKAPVFEGRSSSGLSFGSTTDLPSVAELQKRNRDSNLLSASPIASTGSGGTDDKNINPFYRRPSSNFPITEGANHFTPLADVLAKKKLTDKQAFDLSLSQQRENSKKQAKLREELREKYKKELPAKYVVPEQKRDAQGRAIDNQSRFRPGVKGSALSALKELPGYIGALPSPSEFVQITKAAFNKGKYAEKYQNDYFAEEARKRASNVAASLHGHYNPGVGTRLRFGVETNKRSRGGKVQGYSRGGTVYRADGGGIGGGGMDTSAMSEFGQKMSSLTNALMMFSANADKLIDGLSKIPTEITMKGQHQLQVDITGAEAFNNMEDKFSKMITSKINDQLGKFINKYIPEAKQG